VVEVQTANTFVREGQERFNLPQTEEVPRSKEPLQIRRLSEAAQILPNGHSRRRQYIQEKEAEQK